jgi:hypothetical protein
LLSNDACLAIMGRCAFNPSALALSIGQTGSRVLQKYGPTTRHPGFSDSGDHLTASRGVLKPKKLSFTPTRLTRNTSLQICASAACAWATWPRRIPRARSSNCNDFDLTTRERENGIV